MPDSTLDPEAIPDRILDRVLDTFEGFTVAAHAVFAAGVADQACDDLTAAIARVRLLAPAAVRDAAGDVEALLGRYTKLKLHDPSGSNEATQESERQLAEMIDHTEAAMRSTLGYPPEVPGLRVPRPSV